MAEEKASIIPILKQIPFFENLNDQDNDEIIKNIQYQLYPANYTIFKEGEMGETMYIIRKGQVQVSQMDEATKQPKVIATLNPNDFFGEMALFSDQPRNATITTVQETEVFTLNKRDLFALISEDENMASRVNNEFLERVKQNDNRAKEEITAAPTQAMPPVSPATPAQPTQPQAPAAQMPAVAPAPAQTTEQNQTSQSLQTPAQPVNPPQPLQTPANPQQQPPSAPQTPPSPPVNS